ncbi:MAG: hypothetical protein OEM83_04690 [Gammaproteobacteria bacterium]|nr:hypothetical protein [Gammaproteobacteria bacterium]
MIRDIQRDGIKWPAVFLLDIVYNRKRAGGPEDIPEHPDVLAVAAQVDVDAHEITGFAITTAAGIRASGQVNEKSGYSENQEKQSYMEGALGHGTHSWHATEEAD